MRQGKNTELVKDTCSVRDGGKQPAEVVLINTLREEGDNFENRSGVRAEFLKRGGSQRKFNGCCQALVVVRPKYLRPAYVPLPGQSIVIPHVVRCGGGEQCYGESVEIQPLEKVADNIRPPTVAVDAVEDIACRLHRQCGDYRPLAVSGDSCDPGSDAKTNVVEPAQLLHHGINLPSIRSLRVENRFGVVEDYNHLLGG